VIGLGIQASHFEVDPDQVVSFQGVARRFAGQRFELGCRAPGGAPDDRLWGILANAKLRTRRRTLTPLLNPSTRCPIG
jgi:hypothetical protein